MTERPRVRKRSLAADTATVGRAADEIDIARCATIAYSSEDPAHPVENMLDGQSGPRGTRWVSARPDTAEHIVVEFDQPRAISRLVYEVQETMRERTQEVRVEASDDGGRGIARFWSRNTISAPRGATFQREDQRVDLQQVTHLRLTVVPNKSGSGPATLTTLRLFA